MEEKIQKNQKDIALRNKQEMCRIDIEKIRKYSLKIQNYSSYSYSSVTQSCATLCDPMSHRTPGLLVHHQLPESTQTHVHWVSDAIQPSYLLSSPSPPAFNLSQQQGLFKWVSSSHEVAKVLEFPLQHQLEDGGGLSGRLRHWNSILSCQPTQSH